MSGKCYFCDFDNMIENSYCWRCMIPQYNNPNNPDVKRFCPSCNEDTDDFDECKNCNEKLVGKNIVQLRINLMDMMGDRNIVRMFLKDQLLHSPMAKQIGLSENEFQSSMGLAMLCLSDLPVDPNEYSQRKEQIMRLNDLLATFSMRLFFPGDRPWYRYLIRAGLQRFEMHNMPVEMYNESFYLFEDEEDPLDILVDLDPEMEEFYDPISKLIFLYVFAKNTQLLGHHAAAKYMEEHLFFYHTELAEIFLNRLDKLPNNTTFFDYSLSEISADDAYNSSISLNNGFGIRLMGIAFRFALEVFSNSSYSKPSRKNLLISNYAQFIHKVALKTDPKNNKLLSISLAPEFILSLAPHMWYDGRLVRDEILPDIMEQVKLTLSALDIVNPERLLLAGISKVIEGVYRYGSESELSFLSPILQSYSSINPNKQLLGPIEQLNGLRCVFATHMIHSQIEAGYPNLARVNCDIVEKWLSSNSQKNQVLEVSYHVLNRDNLKNYTHLFGELRDQMPGTQIVKLGNEELQIHALSNYLSGKTYHLNVKFLMNLIENTRLQKYKNVILSSPKGGMSLGMPLTNILFEFEDTGNSWQTATLDAPEFGIVEKFIGKPVKGYVYVAGSQTSMGRGDFVMHQDLVAAAITGVFVEGNFTNTEIADLAINLVHFPYNFDKVIIHLLSFDYKNSTSFQTRMKRSDLSANSALDPMMRQRKANFSPIESMHAEYDQVAISQQMQNTTDPIQTSKPQNSARNQFISKSTIQTSSMSETTQTEDMEIGIFSDTLKHKIKKKDTTVYRKTDFSSKRYKSRDMTFLVKCSFCGQHVKLKAISEKSAKFRYLTQIWVLIIGFLVFKYILPFINLMAKAMGIFAVGFIDLIYYMISGNDLGSWAWNILPNIFPVLFTILLPVFIVAYYISLARQKFVIDGEDKNHLINILANN